MEWFAPGFILLGIVFFGGLWAIEWLEKRYK